MTIDQFKMIKKWIDEVLSNGVDYFLITTDYLHDRFGLEENFYGSLEEYIRDDEELVVMMRFPKPKNYIIKFCKP